MINDLRISVFDAKMATLLKLDASADARIVKYEDTNAGCGAAEITTQLLWEEVDSPRRGYWMGRNVVEISTGDDALQQAYQPAFSAPAAPTLSQVAGGTLPAGTYAYRVAARNLGMTTLGSTEATITTTATGSVGLSWAAVPGATSYDVYGRAAGSEQLLTGVSGTSYTDTGTLTPSGLLPAANNTGTRFYVLSKKAYDTAQGEDVPQVYLFDGVNLCMRIPVTAVGTDVFGDYIVVGAPIAGGGNLASIPATPAGAVVGRRRYAGRIVRRTREYSTRLPNAVLECVGFSKRLGEAVGSFAFSSYDIGGVIWQSISNMSARFPDLVINQSNFPAVGASYSVTATDVTVEEVVTNALTAVPSGDIWALRIGHDRTPRVERVYTASTNTYARTVALPVHVGPYEPQNLKVVDQDATSLFNTVKIIGDTDPVTKQVFQAIGSDTTSISTYLQIDAPPISNANLKSQDAVTSFGLSAISNSGIPTSANELKLFCKNDYWPAGATSPNGLRSGDQVRANQAVVVSGMNNSDVVRNQAPDSGVYQGALWVLSGAWSVVATGPGSSNVWSITGAGAVSNAYASAPQLVNVVAGQQMTLDAWVDPSNCFASGASPGVAVYSADGTTLIASSVRAPNTAAGQTTPTTFTVPGGTTQVQLRLGALGATISNGQTLRVGQPRLEVGPVLHAYVDNLVTPNIYGLPTSVVTTVVAAGDSFQEVKYAAVEPDWNAEMTARANAALTAALNNRPTPAAIDQYCVSPDAFGFSVSGLTLTTQQFLALFALGTTIQTIGATAITLTAGATNYLWLNPNGSFTVKVNDSTPVSNAIFYLWCTTNSTTVTGYMRKASIGVLKVTAGNLIFSTLPVPATTGATITSLGSPTPFAADVNVSVPLTNVPQDGSVTGLAFYFKEHSKTAWTPFETQNLSGLPSPPASQTVALALAQLVNGTTYDFAVGYAGLATFGPLLVVSPGGGVVASSIVITQPYIIGTGVAAAPSVSAVTITPVASVNGLSGAARLQFTVGNHPQDGSLSRLGIYKRITGSTVYEKYSDVPANGLPSPAASSAYDITLNDLTTGQGYDFAATFENAQGAESPLGSIGSLSAQATALPASALPAMPAGSTVTITGFAVNSYGSPNGGATTASVSFTPTIGPAGSLPFSKYGTGFQYWAKVNDSGTSDGDTNALNYFQCGLYANNAYVSGTAITDQFGPLPTGHAYQLAVQPTDQAGSSAPPLAILGLTTAQKIGTPAISGGAGTAPNVLSSSVSQVNRNDSVITRNFVTFKVGDWNTSAANKPANIDKISVVYAYAGDASSSEPTVAMLVDAKSSFAVYDAAGVTFKAIVRTDAGDNVAIGIKYVYADGTESAIAWPTGINNVTDPGGTFPNTGTRTLVTPAGGHNATDFYGFAELAPTDANAGYEYNAGAVIHNYEKSGNQINLLVAPFCFEMTYRSLNNVGLGLILCADGNTNGNTPPTHGYLAFISPGSNILQVYKNTVGGNWPTVLGNSPALSPAVHTNFEDHHVKVVAYSSAAGVTVWIQVDGSAAYQVTDPSATLTGGYFGLYLQTGLFIRDLVWSHSQVDAQQMIAGASLLDISGGHKATDWQNAIEAAPGSTYQGYTVFPSVLHVWEKTGTQPDISKAAFVGEMSGYATGTAAAACFAIWVCSDGNTYGATPTNGYLVEVNNSNLRIYRKTSTGYAVIAGPIPVPDCTTPYDHSLRVIAKADGAAVNIVAAYDGAMLSVRETTLYRTTGYFGMEVNNQGLVLHDWRFRQSDADAVNLNPYAGLTSNAVPDSDVAFGAGSALYWPALGSPWSVAKSPNGKNQFIATGTGAAQSQFFSGATFSLKAGTWVFSALCDLAAQTGGSIFLRILNAALGVEYGRINLPAAGTRAGRYQSSFTLASDVTDAVIVPQLASAVITNGGAIAFSQFQVEAGVMATPYMSNVPDNSGYWPHGAHHPNLRTLVSPTPGSATGVDALIDGTTFSKTRVAVNNRFDSSGNTVDSGLLTVKVPNSVSYVTDLRLYYSFTFVGTGSVNTMVLGWDNGAGGDATLYLPNGISYNLGHNLSAYTDSASNYTTSTNKDNYYEYVYFTPTTPGSNGSGGTMSFNVQKNTPYTVSGVKGAYADGGFLVAQATASATPVASAQSSSGSGGKAPSGNGGRAQN